jgi:hypothetical protein
VDVNELRPAKRLISQDIDMARAGLEPATLGSRGAAEHAQVEIASVSGDLPLGVAE